MLWRYLFKQAVLPPGLFFLLLAAGLLLWHWRPRLALGCVLAGTLGLWLLASPWLLRVLAQQVEREPALAQAQWPSLGQQAQAIVVLGVGRVGGDPGWGEEQPSAAGIERLRYAARIHRASGLPLLLSGGSPQDERLSEAELFRRVLEQDLQLSARWLEEHSRTTWENAQFSRLPLQQAGVQRIVLVTQAAHMPRARWCFEQQGLQVIPAPVGFLRSAPPRPLGGVLPDAQVLWQNSLLVSELAGGLLYPLLYAGDQ